MVNRRPIALKLTPLDAFDTSRLAADVPRLAGAGYVMLDGERMYAAPGSARLAVAAGGGGLRPLVSGAAARKPLGDVTAPGMAGSSSGIYVVARLDLRIMGQRGVLSHPGEPTLRVNILACRRMGLHRQPMPSSHWQAARGTPQATWPP